MKPEHQEKFLGNDKELLVQYCNQYIDNHNIDYFIFGHRHLPLEINIEKAVYFNAGDWLNHNTYIQHNEYPILCYFNH
jgi:UDP-2,3-diacylglucosamine hydrolase